MSWINEKINTPYSDGRYYSVTVEIGHTKSSPGDDGRAAALRAGLLAIGDHYGKDVSRLVGPDPMINSVTTGIITPEGLHKKSNKEELAKRGILLVGPKIDPRPRPRTSKYKVGVLKGFIDLHYNIWPVLPWLDSGQDETSGFNLLEGVWNEYLASGMSDEARKQIPELRTTFKRARSLPSDDNIFATFYSGQYIDFDTPIQEGLYYPGKESDHAPIMVMGPPRPFYDKDYGPLSVDMLGERNTYNYTELGFKNLGEFHKQVETLRLVLIDYQNEHEALTEFQMVHAGTNIPFDLKIVGEELTALREEVKDFIKLNNVGLDKPFTIALRLKTEYTNPAKTSTVKDLISTRGHIAYIRLGDKPLRNEEDPEKWNFIWKGFKRVKNAPQNYDSNISQLLLQMRTILSQPGTSYASVLKRVCSGTPPKPPTLGEEKQRIGVVQFVEKYFLDPTPQRKKIKVKTTKQAFDLFKRLGYGEPKPKSAREVRSERELTKDEFFKRQVANRNRDFSDQVGDYVFAQLPANVDKIKTWDDIWGYVLNRVDLTTIAAEILECIGLGLSIDDIIDMLCDGFLKQIGADPDQVEEALRLVEGTTFSPGGISVVSGAQLSIAIREKMAAYVSQGVEDPFYRAAIEETTMNASGKRLLCEAIMAGIFSLGDLLLTAAENKPDINKADPRPVVSGCPLTFKIPDSIPSLNTLLVFIAQQIEDYLYTKADSLIWIPLNRSLRAITEACDNEGDFGNVDVNEVLAEPNATNDKFRGTGADANNFLEALFAILSTKEICVLFDGEPSAALMITIRSFTEREFPEFSKIFSTNDKLKTFFQRVGEDLDLSVCDIVVTPAPLQDLCRDGETTRQAALREALLARGLSEEEINEQIELDKDIKRQQVADLTSLLSFNRSSNRDIGADSMGLGEIFASSESASRQTGYAIDAAFQGVESLFSYEVTQLVPLIVEQINTYREQGLEIDKLPIAEILNDAVSNFITVGGGGKHSFSLWSPSLDFKPGTLDLDPSSDTFNEYIVGSAEISHLGERGSDQQPGAATINYKILPTQKIETGKKDKYTLAIKATVPTTVVDAVYHDPYLGEKTKTSVRYDHNEIFLSETGPAGKNPEILEKYNPFIEQYQQSAGPQKPYQLFVFQSLFDLALKGEIASANNTEASQEFNESLLPIISERPWAGKRNFSVLDFIYDKIFEQYLEQISEIIASSEYFDLEKLQELDFSSVGEKVLGLDQVKNSVNRLSKANMMNMNLDAIDPGKGTEHLGDAMFEGSIQAYIKLYIAELTMKCLFIFSKFRSEDVFSDSIMSEFIYKQVVDISLPDGTSLYENYVTFLNKMESNLRNQTSSSSEEEINAQVKKEVYGGYDSPKELFISVVEGIFKSGDESQETREALEEVFDISLPKIESDIIEEIKNEGETTEEAPKEIPVPSVDTITTEYSDMSFDQAWAANQKRFEYKGASKLTPLDTIPPLPRYQKFSHTFQGTSYYDYKDIPIYDYGQETESGWHLSEEDKANWNIVLGPGKSTLLREHIPFYPGQYADLRPVEIPAGVTLPPGTAWDPGDLQTVDLSSPVTQDVAFIGQWEVEIVMDKAKVQADLQIKSDTIGGGFDNPYHSAKSSETTLREYFSRLVAGEKAWGPKSTGLLPEICHIHKSITLGAAGDTEPAQKIYADGTGNGAFIELHDEEGSHMDANNDVDILGVTKATFTVVSDNWYQKTFGTPSIQRDFEKNAGYFHPEKYFEQNSELSKDIYRPFINDRLKDVNVEDPSTWLDVNGLPEEYELVDGTASVPVRFEITSWTGDGGFQGSGVPNGKPNYEIIYEERPGKILRRTLKKGLIHNDLDATVHGPVTKEAWERQEASDANDASRYPLIQIRPPVYWYWEGDSGGAFATTYGAEKTVPKVTYFRFTVNGSNFQPNTKVSLAPVSGIGPQYPFEVEYISDTALQVTMPISINSGNQSYPDKAGEYEYTPNAGTIAAKEGGKDLVDKKGGPTGQIYKMNNIRVFNSLLALVVENPGQGDRGVAPMYFHTYNQPWQEWNELWLSPSDWLKQGEPNYSPDSPPEAPPQQISFDEDPIGEKFQAYALPVYGSLDKAWEVVDVADIWGREIEQKRIVNNNADVNIAELLESGNSPPNFALSNQSAASRTINWCEPRLFETEELREKYSTGGFVLEKYIKITEKANHAWPKGPSRSAITDPEYSSFSYQFDQASKSVIGNFIKYDDQNSLGEGAIATSPGKEHTLSYAAFIRLLMEQTQGSANVIEEVIGIQYDILSYGTDAAPGQISQIAPDGRIIISEDANEDDLDSLDEIKGDTNLYADHKTVWSSLQEFIDYDKQFNEFAEYDVRPYKEIKTISTGPQVGDQIPFVGFKVVRLTEDFSAMEDFAEEIEENQNVRKLLFGSWNEVIQDVKYGLRLSYVFPEDVYDKYGNTSFPGGVKAALNTGLNPYSSMDAGETVELYSNQIAALSKQIEDLQDEYSGYMANDNLEKAAPIKAAFDKLKKQRADVYSAAESVMSTQKPGNFSDESRPVLLYPENFLTNLVSSNTANVIQNKSFLNKTLQLKEANSEPGTANIAPESLYVVPMVTVEIGPDDPGFPEQLKQGSLTDLRSAYPTVKQSSSIPYGKLVYDALYKKLKKSHNFRLLFEYVFPSKRLLGLNTLYNILNFDSFFRDNSAFDGVFSNTKDQAYHLLKTSRDTPGGDYGSEDENEG